MKQTFKKVMIEKTKNNDMDFKKKIVVVAATSTEQGWEKMKTLL